MVDEGLAAVDAVERADQIVLLAGIDVVRADEAEMVTEPADGILHLRRAKHGMGDALHP
jgi:hypothetical protein